MSNSQQQKTERVENFLKQNGFCEAATEENVSTNCNKVFVKKGDSSAQPLIAYVNPAPSRDGVLYVYLVLVGRPASSADDVDMIVKLPVDTFLQRMEKEKLSLSQAFGLTEDDAIRPCFSKKELKDIDHRLN